MHASYIMYLFDLYFYVIFVHNNGMRIGTGRTLGPVDDLQDSIYILPCDVSCYNANMEDGGVLVEKPQVSFSVAL